MDVGLAVGVRVGEAVGDGVTVRVFVGVGVCVRVGVAVVRVTGKENWEVLPFRSVLVAVTFGPCNDWLYVQLPSLVKTEPS